MIRDLIIDDKWLYEFRGRSEAEIKRACESISSSVAALNGRYAKPLPAINANIERISDEVDGYLKAMIFNRR